METVENIYAFTDYRAFLVAYAQNARQKDPTWSYGRWARRLGLKGTASITMIIQGKREAGRKIEDSLVRYFRFSPKDAQYFRDLVRLHKIRHDPRLSVVLMEKMGRDYRKGSIRILDGDTFSVISNWYYWAIREMVRMDAFFEDPEWISKKLRFKVAPRDVSRALATLLKLNLLRRTPEGDLVVTDEEVTTDDDVASEGVKRYYEQMLENAKQAVRSVDVAEREFQGESFVMSSANLPKAKQLIREFREKFVKLVEGGGDRVMQFQIQLFPLTKKEAEK